MAQSSRGPVFMSYSRRDEAVTRRIVDFLRAQGINVWLDNEKLIPGTPIWEEEIEKAIKATDAVVVVMSPDSKDSEWVRREISLADQYRKRIFPVLARGDEDTSITLRLITRQFVDLRANEKVSLKSLSAALANYLEGMISPEQLVNESAEKLSYEKAIPQRPARERAETDGIRHISEAEPFPVGSPKLQQRPIIDQTIPTSSWTSVFWITLGWVIGGAVGGAIYWAWSDYGEVLGGAIGWAIGGAVTAITLRMKKILSNRRSVFWIALAWAMGGAIGWGIGEARTEAGGAALGGAIGAAIGVVISSRIEHVLSNWKSMLWIIMTWAFSWAVGWPIGEAIGWSIAGFVMGWQFMKRE